MSAMEENKTKKYTCWSGGNLGEFAIFYIVVRKGHAEKGHD